MTDITLEQRARELLAAECRAEKMGVVATSIEQGMHVSGFADIALRAIEEALRLSAGADSARLDALEALVDSQPDKALLLHHGIRIIRDGERRYSGLGLSNTRRTLREAIDQAALRPSAGEGKGISASHKKHDGPCWRNSHADCGC